MLEDSLEWARRTAGGTFPVREDASSLPRMLPMLDRLGWEASCWFRSPPPPPILLDRRLFMFAGTDCGVCIILFDSMLLMFGGTDCGVCAIDEPDFDSGGSDGVLRLWLGVSVLLGGSDDLGRCSRSAPRCCCGSTDSVSVQCIPIPMAIALPSPPMLLWLKWLDLEKLSSPSWTSEQDTEEREALEDECARSCCHIPLPPPPCGLLCLFPPPIC
mmetsp:Transcript_45675/g.97094  ORF Transcript_45675/g.97094 Transcript_45675/m.97094 type:complete len:215 (+) Transcript_45675:58-702(+)